MDRVDFKIIRLDQSKFIGNKTKRKGLSRTSGIKRFIPDNGAKNCWRLSHTWGLSATKIFKLLDVSLGASLESSTVTWSWLRLGLTPNEAKGGRPY